MTKKITLTNLGIIDGWTPASETWAYASATTITVPSGAGTKYQKGDKFKLTANSVVLQGYIIIVADELLTVVGDALTNHTFTANYYSHATSPIGFPTWFNHTAVLVGFSADPINDCSFSMNGSTVFFRHSCSTNGTSNANSYTVSLPITAASTVTKTWKQVCQVVDNNTVQLGIVSIRGAVNTVATLKSTVAEAVFITSGNKSAAFEIWYEI